MSNKLCQSISNPTCNREVALSQKPEADQDLAEQLFMICDKDLSDYAAETAENATTSCDWRVPMDGELVAIGGHMHTQGTSLRVTLNPDSANPIILQDLPIWDFNWQGSYDLVTPIQVKEGDTMRLTCTWNNTNEVDPDNFSYMTWGEGTNDEMCLNVAIIKPAEGFEELEGTTLFVNSLAIFPDWMPTTVRSGMLLMTSLSTFAQWLVVVTAVLLLLGVAMVIRRVDWRQIGRQSLALLRLVD